MNRAEIESIYSNDEPDMLFADGFDKAIMGTVYDSGRTRVVYNMERILEILMIDSSMTYEEAIEYFDFNISGAYVGEYTPLYLQT